MNAIETVVREVIAAYRVAFRAYAQPSMEHAAEALRRAADEAAAADVLNAPHPGVVWEYEWRAAA